MRWLTAIFLFLLPAMAAAQGLGDVEGHYRVEPQSIIRFSVSQLGGQAIAGRFLRFSGTFELGGRDLGRSVVSFSLEPASVKAADPRVEAFIKSPAVFDVERFSEVRYRSSRIVRTGERTARIDGRLTAKGVTRDTHFDIELVDSAPALLRFHVTGKMSRALFGMDVGTPIYSNMVELDMDLYGRRQ